MQFLSISTPIPLLPGISFVAFPLVEGAFGSQLATFILDESLFCSLILESLSYPRAKDNSLICPVKSLSTMETDPPNLPPSPPPDETSLIVG
jgi:hypothetical protein